MCFSGKKDKNLANTLICTNILSRAQISGFSADGRVLVPLTMSCKEPQGGLGLTNEDKLVSVGKNLIQVGLN